MTRRRTLLGATVLMILALLVPSGSAAASTTPARHRTAFLFALVTPNIAVADASEAMAAPGDWIEVTGGGTFNPGTSAVRAGGGFVHHSADGTIQCRGTWRATALTGWTDFNTAANGRRHGGIVSLTVTHYCPAMGETHAGLPMTVTSILNAPPGSSYAEGVTVADFTRSTAGTVRICARGQRHHRVPASRAHFVG